MFLNVLNVIFGLLRHRGRGEKREHGMWAKKKKKKGTIVFLFPIGENISFGVPRSSRSFSLSTSRSLSLLGSVFITAGDTTFILVRWSTTCNCFCVRIQRNRLSDLRLMDARTR